MRVLCVQEYRSKLEVQARAVQACLCVFMHEGRDSFRGGCACLRAHIRLYKCVCVRVHSHVCACMSVDMCWRCKHVVCTRSARDAHASDACKCAHKLFLAFVCVCVLRAGVSQ